ncbi:MAG: hypothetical protein ACI9FJ_002938 [Alteromonadaceae bacterium]|jgi:hypothetical protein
MAVYMTRQRALKAGFTHHGSYHGIPMWLGGIDGVPVVCAKIEVLEHVVSLFHYLEKQFGRLRQTRPIFRFKVGRQIDEMIS